MMTGFSLRGLAVANFEISNNSFVCAEMLYFQPPGPSLFIEEPID